MKKDDRGSALPIVLVIVMVLSVIVINVATYEATDLHYSRITADRAARLASADAVMNYAVDQLKLRNAACLLGGGGGVSLPGLAANLNGATATVSCQRVGGGINDIQAWAAVVTGDGGLTNSDYLLSTQGGNAIDKLLGGPVYMNRVNASAFNLGPNVKIKDGPLYNYDPTCTTPATTATLPSQVLFEPNLIYGPICTTVPWTTLFGDPLVPDLTVSASFPNQSTAVPPWVLNGGCRVFSPGVYTAPPDLSSAPAYFKSGNYYFLNVDLQVGAAVTAGYADNSGIAPNEITNSVCDPAQAADVQPPGTPSVPSNAGATFYLGGTTHITINAAGSLEINLRKQGTNYVSVQTLCTPALTPAWCDQTGGATGVRSTLTGAGTDAVVYTQPGNKKQFVTHGLLYAPTARLEFGNATNSAEQKILGGLVVARLVLQSSASATNFAIQVATSPIDVTVLLTATATKNGTTTIRAVIDYRPYSTDIKQRLAISSWRVT